LPNMVFVKDATDLRFVRINKAGEDLLGHSRETLIGKNDYDFFPQAEADFFTAKDRETLASGRLLDIPDEPIQTRLGLRYLHTKKISISDDHGSPLYLVGISEDITERKRAEEDLRVSEERWELACLGSNDGIWDWDIPAGTVFYSSRWKAMRGRAEHEVTDSLDEWKQHIHPDDLDRVMQRVAAHFAGETPIIAEEYRVRRKDGSWMWVSDRGLVLRDETGTPVRMAGSETDITERKQAEASLQEQTRLSMLTADVNGALVRNTTLPAMLQACTEALAQHLHAAFARIWLIGPGDLCHDCVKAAHCSNRERCLHLQASTGLSHDLNGEYRRVPLGALKIGRIAQGSGAMHTNDVFGDDRLPNKDWMRSNGLRSFAGYPLVAGEETQGVVMMFARRPLTSVELAALETAAKTVALGVSRKRGEEALKDLNEHLVGRTQQLVDANTELEAFSYSVSHDLRGPLQGLFGYLELLKRRLGSPADEKVAQHLEKLAEAARRMEQLITDLLAFAKSGHDDLRLVPIDVNQVVAGVIEDLHLECQGREIAWRIAELPLVQGDLSLLRQVVANLIANAVKYTRYRPHATIDVDVASCDDREAVFVVKDNGAGFDMQHADHLFEAFHRLHSKRQFEGTGIGLATVRRILHRHGGRIWAEGAVDRGAAFYFSLPLAKDGQCLEPASPMADRMQERGHES
ncbi:MAG: PAS domain S-box protein, partial [Nitrospira sp.]|nr:PAS domain S-box protein [Nitrospira sp.]